MSREYTSAEVREQIIEYIWDLIHYWEKETRKEKTRDKLEGLAFSMLTMLDGCSMALPAFSLVTDPHPTDKDYCKENDENWYPERKDITKNVMLHDMFYAHRRK